MAKTTTKPAKRKIPKGARTGDFQPITRLPFKVDPDFKRRVRRGILELNKEEAERDRLATETSGSAASAKRP